MTEDQHRSQAANMCLNNCGFFGSPTTQNLCSKCYRYLQQKEQQALALSQTFISTSAAASQPSYSSFSSSAFFPIVERVVVDANVEEEEKKEEAVPSAGSQPNKCTACRRRVGLTRFKCRCGMTFCGSGTHRYPEQHACGFDFRSMGREQIAKANTVIKGEKLQNI